MSLYLSADSVAESLGRLQQSSAQTRLCEFLIGLRTLKLSDSDVVQVTETVSQFMQALNELTACAPEGIPSTFTGRLYINPFGTGRAKSTGRAYKSDKFPSNGPSVTIYGWATQQDRPFDITDTKPKGIRRRAVTQDQLRSFLLLKGARLDERPRLLDAAVWYFRGTDLDVRFGAEPSEEQLAMEFATDVALTSDDINALFITEVPEAQDAG